MYGDALDYDALLKERMDVAEALNNISLRREAFLEEKAELHAALFPRNAGRVSRLEVARAIEAFIDSTVCPTRCKSCGEDMCTPGQAVFQTTPCGNVSFQCARCDSPGTVSLLANDCIKPMIDLGQMLVLNSAPAEWHYALVKNLYRVRCVFLAQFVPRLAEVYNWPSAGGLSDFMTRKRQGLVCGVCAGACRKDSTTSNFHCSHGCAYTLCGRCLKHSVFDYTASVGDHGCRELPEDDALRANHNIVSCFLVAFDRPPLPAYVPPFKVPVFVSSLLAPFFGSTSDEETSDEETNE